MIVSLLAALQVATAAPEWVWADIYLDDTRGSGERIEILPKVVIEAGRRTVRSVTARRTRTFLGKITEVQWTDSDRCPGLRISLDAISEVRVLAESTLAATYEGPAVLLPPPIHRPVATVKVGSATITAVPDSQLRRWVHTVLQTTGGCWNAKASGSLP